jgi:hypothetical protein
MQNPPKAFGFWWILFKQNHAAVAWFEIGFALTSRLHRRKVWEFQEPFSKGSWRVQGQRPWWPRFKVFVHLFQKVAGLGAAPR